MTTSEPRHTLESHEAEMPNCSDPDCEFHHPVDEIFESGWSDRHGSHVDRGLFRDNERYRIGWLEADATLRMITSEAPGE